ncbi:MAG: hypothetical protein RJA57_926, partial [Bacteroidota bacterium]
MRRTIWTALVLFSFIPGFSQKIYFIYIQSEARQPFYVRMDNKQLSSSASGYLILSRLRDSVYSIGLGFPGGKEPEQRYRLTIEKKDHGYLLKDFGEKGWGLFDLQTLSVQYADSAYRRVSQVTPVETIEVSAFTDILSKAADDPTLRVKQRTEPVKTDARVIVSDRLSPEVVDTVVVAKAEAVRSDPGPEKRPVPEPPFTPEVEDAPKGDPVSANPNRASKVTRVAELTTSEGLELVFIDAGAEGEVDTVRLLISAPPVHLVSSEPAADTSMPVSPVLQSVVDSAQTADAGSPMPKERNEAPRVEAPADTRSVRANNCPAVADEADFLRLRKK